MVSLMLLSVAVFSTLRGVAGQSSFLPRFCTTWPHLECVGENNALVTTKVRVWYDYSDSNLTRSETGPTLFDNDEIQKVYNLTYPNQSVHDGAKSGEYYFEQLEHGGGDCNCVYIDIACIENNRSA